LIYRDKFFIHHFSASGEVPGISFSSIEEVSDSSHNEEALNDEKDISSIPTQMGLKTTDDKEVINKQFNYIININIILIYKSSVDTPKVTGTGVFNVVMKKLLDLNVLLFCNYFFTFAVFPALALKQSSLL